LAQYCEKNFKTSEKLTKNYYLNLDLCDLAV